MIKITSVTIHDPSDRDLDDIVISVADEGGGPFLIIQQMDSEIRLEFSEFDELINAVNLLRT